MEDAPSSLNPLFIRSSIPFRSSKNGSHFCKPRSQSLIHQVIYSVQDCFLGMVQWFLMSQSLIHQVIYSVARLGWRSQPALGRSQSLIHQVIYSVGRRLWPLTAGASSGLNPLFIRSSIPFPGMRKGSWCGLSTVSIPYSSGHLFRYDSQRQNDRTTDPTVSIPYSSGHLFRCKQERPSEVQCKSVSIPYSSGHLFRSTDGRSIPGK